VTDPLHERGIFLTSNYRLIDCAGSVRRHGLACNRLAIDVQREILKGGPRWQREDVVRFGYPAASVQKRLGDLETHDAISEVCTDIAAYALDTPARAGARTRRAGTPGNAGRERARSWENPPLCSG
jgi:hypothetical protein